MSNQPGDFGSVEGVLEAEAVGRFSRFHVLEDLSQTRVSCLVPHSLMASVREALGHRISVWGRLDYMASASVPSAVSMEGFRILGREKLPDIEEITGILLE